jgi:hypothetical protein
MKQEGCLKTLWCAWCHSMSTHQLKSGKWVCLGQHRGQRLAGQQAESGGGFTVGPPWPWLPPCDV